MYHTFESIESEIENYSSLKVCDILRESLIVRISYIVIFSLKV